MFREQHVKKMKKYIIQNLLFCEEKNFLIITNDIYESPNLSLICLAFFVARSVQRERATGGKSGDKDKFNNLITMIPKY